MTKRWQEHTGTFRVCNEAGEEAELMVISSFREDRDLSGVRVHRSELKELKDENGRHVNPVEGQELQFTFYDAPSHILTVVDEDEFREAMK